MPTGKLNGNDKEVCFTCDFAPVSFGIWQMAATGYFLDSLCWPDGRKVYVDGSPVAVSLNLYNAMKQDLRIFR